MRNATSTSPDHFNKNVKQAAKDKDALLSTLEAERVKLSEQLHVQRDLSKVLREKLSRSTAQQRETAATLGRLRMKSKVTVDELTRNFSQECEKRKCAEDDLEATRLDLERCRAECWPRHK